MANHAAQLDRLERAVAELPPPPDATSASRLGALTFDELIVLRHLMMKAQGERTESELTGLMLRLDLEKRAAALDGMAAALRAEAVVTVAGAR